MSEGWEPGVKVARRAAARLLLAHRAGLVVLGTGGEELCVAACSWPQLKRVLRLKIGRMWALHGATCPPPAAPGGPRRGDERDGELREVLGLPPLTE